jgi:hypothetical protein
MYFWGVDMISKYERHYWHAASPAEWQDSDTPYELVTLCIWSVVVVSLTALLMWLALSGAA